MKSCAFVNFINKYLDFFRKIVFSDKTHFEVGGYVNYKNFRIKGKENTLIINEEPVHLKRIRSVCIVFGCLIGPYFSENAAGEAVAANSDRYCAFEIEFLWPELMNIALEDFRWQEYSVTPDFANSTMNDL